ncbi:hypothetical protein A3A66_01005 [Microgenomates group bacterium RIFCSPLOWO2_01_FULL_46_13]|nr:MAG: hypothetical protein A2783_01250 [Microgenomates group bacterium RIFCSPHIGHO2_01_FULL_45_11]OGV94585.1 MAG: hypothetical protein A3A66_01005 [Microgenomates group bacterium RIFCSPLOWO2_01_FULL_46_13]
MQIPFFKRWHPALALRYLPIVRLINRNESVLEVGSGSLGIGPYLRRGLTGVDVDFSGPEWPDMKRVEASATNLPQADDSFDVVINLDMLEHLAPRDRQKAIEEMVRVAKKKIIIGVPVGELAARQDELVDKLYEKIWGRRHKFLKEQTEYGLPTEAEMEDMIYSMVKRRGKTVKMKVIPNENLKMRWWLMKGWASKNFWVNVFFRKILLLAIPILRLFNHEPVYRKIYYCRLI